MKSSNYLIAAMTIAVGAASARAGSSDLPACPPSASENVYRHNCRATVQYPNGVYSGDFQNNKRNGEGIWTYPNGAKYVGRFRDGAPNGRGTYYFVTGAKYVGDFRDGKFNGQGAWYGANGSVVSSGKWINDKFIPASRPAAGDDEEPAGGDSVSLERGGNGLYQVPITLNGTLTVAAMVDSGASTVCVPTEVFAQLENSATVSKSDHIGMVTNSLADGRRIQVLAFKLRSLKVGSIVLHDLNAVVVPTNSPVLLGQSFLGRFKSWSLDNNEHRLRLKQ